MTTRELIPRKVLFGNPERFSPRVSPDGKRLAYIAPHDGVLNVFVGAVGSDDFSVVTDDRDRGIRFFDWAHDNQHLIYAQDKGGDENWRLYDVDLDTGAVRDLTPFDGVQVQPIGESKRRPHELLFGMNKDNPELHDVYKVDFRTGEHTKIEENPGFIGWVADDELRVRAGAAPTADGGFVLMVRDAAGGEWRPLLTVGQEDSLTTNPVGFDASGENMFVITSAGANAGRLVRLHVATGEQTELAGDAQYDVTQVVQHPDTHEPQLVGVLKDRLEWQVLDESMAGDLAALAVLGSGDVSIESRDHTDRTWIVSFMADDGPVRYYVWDRDNQRGTYLFSHRPALEKFDLAPMEPFSFAARDGLEVHGYISFPPGVERSNLAAVLNVHGGPWARDVWGLNPEAQWLASRGYACIQVNYRGSTGYGKEFVNAGDREWAGKMHDDLLDAIEFVVGKGWVDRERIAIYGGSYGGYAALVGATFTPDVFCCAVDIVGPSNIKTLIESVPPYWAPLIAQFHTRVGNPETDEEFLWSRSPLSKVDQIKIPMLIAQGANDPRVKQAESEQIVEAMREKGTPHEYMLFEDEGHGFAKPENRLTFYAAAEKFLALHLGGACEEEAGSPGLA
jgi:dipeptidyl aminopeptidase/acylaminoacyl peptidase